MIIALDYDDTYTRDPDFWDKFIDLASSKNHTVVCVTMRYPHEIDKNKFPNIEIITTSRQAKFYYIMNNGVRIDVWIDNDPLFLFNDG